MNNPDAIPNTPKGRPARISAADFPYKFPVSPRHMGRGFPISNAKKRLARFYYGHMLLMRSFAGWVIQAPEFEVKIELGHHIYAHAEAARLLRNRLVEFLVPKAELNELPSPYKKVQQELLHAHNTAELIEASRVITCQLYEDERKYLEETDQLLDLPSIRILKIIRSDSQSISQWNEGAVKAFVNGGMDAQQLNQWGSHIESVLRAAGFFQGDPGTSPFPRLRQDEEPPFERAVGCARDDRFTTFHDTRDYKQADDLAKTAITEYESDRLELIRVQRDEIDAIETFANVLFDLPNAEFDLQMDLARLIWDEARHAEIGHQELERLGFKPFEVPCGIIGINVRSPLRPEIALAQISIFGELNIVGPMRRLSDRAATTGDRQTQITFDFIHSDEVLHLRRGRQWLTKLHPLGDLKLMGEEARIEAIQRLIEEGVVGEEYAMNLSGAEIHALIGGE